MENLVEQVVYFEAVCKNCLSKKNTKGMSQTTRPEFVAELEAEGWKEGFYYDDPQNPEAVLYCGSCDAPNPPQ